MKLDLKLQMFGWQVVKELITAGADEYEKKKAGEKGKGVNPTVENSANEMEE